MVDAAPPEVWDLILDYLGSPSDLSAVNATCAGLRAICLGGSARSRILGDAKTIMALSDGPFEIRLMMACHYGHLGTAQWLVGAYPGVADNPQRAFRAACEYGHLSIAQWLADRFGLTPADARADDNGALRYARANGHRHTVEWLRTRFGLS